MLVEINNPEILKMMVNVESIILAFSIPTIIALVTWVWKIYGSIQVSIKGLSDMLNEMLEKKKYEEDQRVHTQEHINLQNELKTQYQILTDKITEYRFETLSKISGIEQSIAKIETSMSTILRLYEDGKIKID
jgi:hypothetical protein